MCYGRARNISETMDSVIALGDIAPRIDGWNFSVRERENAVLVDLATHLKDTRSRLWRTPQDVSWDCIFGYWP